MQTTSKGRWLKNEDNLENKDDLKNKDNLKNEDDDKNEDDHKILGFWSLAHSTIFL